MISFFIPFLTSVGALTFEFASIHFLSMSLGHSAFGSSFVIGLFLCSMGLGAWWADSRVKSDLLVFPCQLILCVLCLAYLPLAVHLAAFLKSLSWGLEDCRSLLCSSEGLGLILFHVFFLLATGFLVGAEIPFFTRLFRSRLGVILAGDYSGAFLAGLIFPFVFLPQGLWLSLLFALLCYLVATAILLARLKPALPKWFRPAFFAVAFIWLAGCVFASDVEKSLIERLVRPSGVTDHRVLYFRQSSKQQILISESTAPDGRKDRRLYLDGFMQFSSLWNTEGYHRKMVEPARRALGDGAKSVLILGGGDGIAASTVLRDHPEDQVRVVDFDCDLLDEVRTHPAFREWISEENVTRVQWDCADAFWYVRSSREKFDLILVDFPHGVGDAAALKVESLEFLRDLRSIAAPEGRVVLQHEKYHSPQRLCVEDTLIAAGFDVFSEPVSVKQKDGEAMLLAKPSATLPDWDATEVQTTLRAPCFSPAAIRQIWIGS